MTADPDGVRMADQLPHAAQRGDDVRFRDAGGSRDFARRVEVARSGGHLLRLTKAKRLPTRFRRFALKLRWLGPIQPPGCRPRMTECHRYEVAQVE